MSLNIFYGVMENSQFINFSTMGYQFGLRIVAFAVAIQYLAANTGSFIQFCDQLKTAS